MIKTLNKFWEEKHKVQLDGEWFQLAEYIEAKYIPKSEAQVSVTIEGDVVTFLKREKSAQAPHTQAPQGGTFQQASNFKPENNTKHVVGDGLSSEDLNATLDRISSENNVIATQTHFRDGKWAYVCYMK